jgi:hypothetical protein
MLLRPLIFLGSASILYIPLYRQLFFSNILDSILFGFNKGYCSCSPCHHFHKSSLQKNGGVNKRSSPLRGNFTPREQLHSLGTSFTPGSNFHIGFKFRPSGPMKNWPQGSTRPPFTLQNMYLEITWKISLFPILNASF